MCRLMRFWTPVFEEVTWSVRALLPVRSPLEVGWSLARRDALGPSYGCLLWLRHVLDAEAETRGMVRAILDWPQFLRDPSSALARVSEQLKLNWPSRSQGALAEIDSFVSVDLRHERASDDDLRTHPINDLARETYACLLELVEDPGNGCVLRRLDDLRARFESAVEIFGPAMLELEKEIAAAQTTIAHIADRYVEKSSGSKRFGFRDVWKKRSQSPRPSLANTKDLEAIRNSVFFDTKHYLEANPDVRAAGMDAALHHLLHGDREGRDPGPLFSTGAYLARYPDVAAAGVNALLHYETLGRREKRHALRDPDPASSTARVISILELRRRTRRA